MKDLTDIDIIVIIAARVSGTSWPAIGHRYGWTGQNLRRFIKRTLFPSRKKL